MDNKRSFREVMASYTAKWKIFVTNGIASITTYGTGIID